MTRIPYGVAFAPAVLSKMRNDLFYHLKDESILYFFDDLLIFSEDIDSHTDLLIKVFDILQKSGFTVSKKNVGCSDPILTIRSYYGWW